MSDPNLPPQPPGPYGNQPPVPPGQPPMPPQPPPMPPAQQPPMQPPMPPQPPPMQPPQQPGYPPQQPGYPPQQPGYPPQQPGMAPPPPAGPGGYQPYQPGASGRMIPELGLRQDEPWKRVVARIIDGIILAIPNFILAAVLLSTSVSDCFDAALRGDTIDCGPGIFSYVLYGLLATVISGAYYIGFTMVLQSTPGKLLMGLKVVKQDGGVVDIQTAGMRWALDGATSIISILPFSAGRWLSTVALLGLSIYNIYLLFTDSKQQDLYDKIGKTYVVCK